MSFIIPDFSSIFCVSKYCVRYSYILIAIIPVLLLMFWFARRTFLRFKNRFELEAYLKSKKIDRRIVLFLRSIAIIFVMFAIASPFILESKTVQGDPRLTILADNSSSMAIYKSQMAYDLFSKLEGSIPVEIRTIAVGEKSPLGDGMLNNIEGDDNVLVVSDGSSNEGKLLGDIMLFAASINTTVSTLKMDAIHNDVGVTIEGPPELILDTEDEFAVKVNVVGKPIPYKIQVSLDDSKLLVEESDSETKEFRFTRKFGEGEYHKLTARLIEVGEDDYFRQNNEFYKTIKIIPRPKILFVTEKPSPLATELDKIYELKVVQSLPSDFSDYMAIIFNNMPSSKILPSFDGLTSFINDGNGVIFVGGDSSFERGGYKGTLLETILPVKIGSTDDQNKSDVSVVLVIDISSGTEEYINYEKALALNVVESLSEKNNVGAVAFGYTPCQAFTVSPIKPLKEIKKELKDKISRLKFDGQSCFDIGIRGAAQLLNNVGGGKNIIFISDGKTTYTKLKEDTLNTVRGAYAVGIKTFVVGVGTDTDTMSTENNIFLGNMAALGGGVYFKTDASNRLKIEFGENDGQSEEFYNTLVPIDTTHFITLGMDNLRATVAGYNYVVPKPAARALVTTQKNIPMLVVWRFGLGRVVTLSTDDGSRWAGDLLNKANSKLITKSINWAIGDLARKKSYDVTVRDTAIGDDGRVNVVSRDMPKSPGIEFAKIDTNFYSAKFNPEGSGYKDILGATYAVNYNQEYSSLGVNSEFMSLVDKTGGKAFDPDDVDGIVEFIRSKSKRIKISSTDYRWPFAIIALVLFLLEIALRRYRENLQR